MNRPWIQVTLVRNCEYYWQPKVELTAVDSMHCMGKSDPVAWYCIASEIVPDLRRQTAGCFAVKVPMCGAALRGLAVMVFKNPLFKHKRLLMRP